MEELNLSKEEFARDFKLKEKNWFYAGMTDIWLSFLTGTIAASGSIDRALDVGCGAGGKAAHLQKIAKNVFGVDLSIDALRFSENINSLKLAQATICKLPYKDGSYDLINVFDVLEHVEDDMAALGELNRVLADNGFLIMAVPAFSVLWSQHDIANFHKRRYNIRDLREKLERAGFEFKRASYANFFLFPALLVYRTVQYRILRPFFKVKRTRVEDVPGFLNTFLKNILALEACLIKAVNFPFGVALLCVARKKSALKRLSKYLSSILVCPKCKAPLKVTETAEPLCGELACGICLNKYPIRSGIPRFIDQGMALDKKRTALNFGYSWKTFSEYHDFYREQFLDWIWPASERTIEGKVVLDAGCGNGRHIYQVAGLGAREIVGFDLSEAIDVAYRNTAEFKNVHLLQADIYNLPLLPVFDYIYCIGVLHHLPDPGKGFRSLAKLLKAGGRISIWVYAKEGNFVVRNFIDPVRKHVTSKMPLPILYLLSYPFSFAMFIIVKFVPVGEYFRSISGFNFRAIHNIVFDQLVAATTHYISRGEVERWFKGSGLEDVVITRRNENGWRGTGVVPANAAQRKSETKEGLHVAEK